MADTATAVDFVLPSLGSDMEAGTVIEWLVAVGDSVHKGDVLVRVDTEKADIDVEVWHDAVVAELLVGPGTQVPVGTALARLEVEGAARPTQTATAPRVTTPQPLDATQSKIDAPSEPDGPSEPEAASEHNVFAAMIIDGDTPSPRPDARNHNELAVSPRLVYWPAPAAQSTTQPVHAQSDASAKATPSREERRQAALASLMEQSNREIPHFHVTRQLDLTEAIGALNEHNSSVPPTKRILPAALLLAATASAAADTSINGSTETAASPVDLAVAVHLRGGGLVTPVIPAAESLTVAQLMQELQDLVARAKAGRMSSRDATPATLTVTNLGDTGADRVFGVIRPPQRALIGFGSIAERAVVCDGAVVARTTVEATVTADHRIVNGHAAARFLARLDAQISARIDQLDQGEPS